MLKRFFILISIMIIGTFSLSADYDYVGCFGEKKPVPYHYYGGYYSYQGYFKGFEDYGYCIRETPDGNFIIAGVTRRYPSMTGLYLIKTDAFGNKLWNFSPYSWRYSRYFSVCVDDQVPGGDRYVAVGYYQVLMYNTKLSVYSTNHGGHSRPYYNHYLTNFNGGGNDIECTVDGYIIAGDCQGKFLVLHLAKNLTDTIWKYVDNSVNCAAYDVEILPDNDNEGFVATGGATIKFDREGNIEWTKPYGGSAICLTDDGGYAICGPSEHSGAGNAYLVKTDSNGDTLWWFSDDLLDVYSHAHDVIQTPDGGYLIVGGLNTNTDAITSGYDIHLIRLNAQGEFIGRKLYDGTWTCPSGLNDQDEAYSVVLNNDDFIITGKVRQIVPVNDPPITSEKSYDVFFLRQPDEFGLGFEDIDKDTETLINTENTNSISNFYASKINQDQTNISYTIFDAGYVDISIYNTIGQEVCNIFSNYQEPGTYNINWNNSDRNNNELPTGIYFITLKSNNQSCKSITIPIVN